MFEVSLVLLGAILVMYGWYAGGVTESRTTAVATGIPAAILGGIAIFTQDTAVTTWALAGTGAVLGALIALSAYWEVVADRAVGLYSLFFGIVTILITSALAREAEQLDERSTGSLILTIAAALIFVSQGLIPQVRGFYRFVGWAVLVLGAVVAFFGFATALGVEIGG